MKIFSGSANEALAGSVAHIMGISWSPLEIHVFPDGERRIRVTEKVVDEDCIIIQSACTPVDSNYMELFFMVDALRRSGAKTVNVVVPYFGYQRQDHVFRDGEAVSLEVVIRLLESLGIDHFISFDLHSIKIPELFHIPVVHLSALPVFADLIKRSGWDHPDTVLVSPDIGGLRRIKLLQSMLSSVSIASIDKSRDRATGEVHAEGIGEGSIAGKKKAIIVDDMISSGKTIITAADILRQGGISDISVFATHPIFSASAPQLLQESQLSQVVVTDTVSLPKEKHFAKLTVVSIADIIGTQLHTLLSSRE